MDGKKILPFLLQHTKLFEFRSVFVFLVAHQLKMWIKKKLSFIYVHLQFPFCESKFKVFHRKFALQYSVFDVSNRVFSCQTMNDSYENRNYHEINKIVETFALYIVQLNNFPIKFHMRIDRRDKKYANFDAEGKIHR